MKHILLAGVSILVGSALSSSFAEARDRVQIVGSSTVFPFTTAVAERYGQKSGKAPIVESTGTGGGMKLFCSGVGVATPDATGASRRIKQSELDDCKKNGVTPVEVKIGFDGIVIANSKRNAPSKFSIEQVYLALAADVPDASGQMVKNPVQNWSQIDPSLPNKKIEVLGPPPTSGTRDAFNELVMEEGCKKVQKRLNVKVDAKACMKIREDGAFVEAGENDNLIVQKLDSNSSAYGVFGYSFLAENKDKIQGTVMDGLEPTFENISSGKYEVSRSLYFYVKKEHVGVVPGIAEFLTEYTSEAAWGDDGYLADKGLIPLPKPERDKVAQVAQNMAPLTGLSGY